MRHYVLYVYVYIEWKAGSEKSGSLPSWSWFKRSRQLGAIQWWQIMSRARWEGANWTHTYLHTSLTFHFIDSRLLHD